MELPLHLAFSMENPPVFGEGERMTLGVLHLGLGILTGSTPFRAVSTFLAMNLAF